jgi:hypothetical protein
MTVVIFKEKKKILGPHYSPIWPTFVAVDTADIYNVSVNLIPSFSFYSASSWRQRWYALTNISGGGGGLEQGGDRNGAERMPEKCCCSLEPDPVGIPWSWARVKRSWRLHGERLRLLYILETFWYRWESRRIKCVTKNTLSFNESVRFPRNTNAARVEGIMMLAEKKKSSARCAKPSGTPVCKESACVELKQT